MMSENASGEATARWYTDERLVILAIGVLGLLLRITNLNSVPFSSTEARDAIGALSAARSTLVGTASSPIYQSLTALNFYLFRANPFFARLWPALAGSSLAFVPLLWRKKLGSLPAVLLAGAFAFDPVLVTLSRQAGGGIFTAVGLIWAASLFMKRKPVGLGIALAAAWLSGPWFWIAVGASGLGLGLYAWSQSQAGRGRWSETCPFRTKGFRDAAAISFIVSMVIIATGFFLNPADISGAASGLAQFWPSSQDSGQVPLVTSIFRLAAYSIPVLLLALPAALSAWKEKNKQNQIISLTAGLVLISVLLFRRFGGAGFVLLHCLLWLLAVETLTKQIRLNPEHKHIALAAFILGISVGAYLALTAKKLVNPVQIGYSFGQSAIALILGLLLLLLVFVLIMMGWSLTTARKGIVSAVMLWMLAFIFSLSFLAVKPDSSFPALAWSDSTVWLSSETQESLIEEIIRLGKLEPQVTRVAITDAGLESLRWEFRDYQQVDVAASVPESSAPGIILSSAADPQKPSDSYRGIKVSNPGSVPWSKISPVELLRSAVSRKLPVETIEYTLWIRQDLMTGALP